MIDILAILTALGLRIYLAFRGVTLLVLGLGMALLAALMTGGLPLLATYTQIFMRSTGDFIIAFFPQTRSSRGLPRYLHGRRRRTDDGAGSPDGIGGVLGRLLTKAHLFLMPPSGIN